MKKITLLSAVMLSAGLVACGGGDPKSASSKPDSLLPDGYVPPSSASSSSTSSTGSGIIKQAIPFHENFDSATNTRTFFTAGYKPLNTNTAQSFYFPAGGFLDEFGNPSPTATSWITADANRKLRIGNGRLTFGQTKLEVNTTTADTTVPTWGEFDLSKAYKVSFCVVQVSAASASNFELYVDNNTTGGNNSIYGAGNASRILQVATHTLVPGTRVEAIVPKAAGDKQIGSPTSFFQFRVSSGGWAVIDDVVVEYAGEPHGFALPTCVAENSIAPEPETPPATPAAPTIIVGDAELVASWTSVGTGATYEVAYNTTSDVTSATAFSGNPVTGTSAQLTGLVNGQEYFVWVKAKNVVGSSEYSLPSSGTPVAPTGTDASKEWGFNSFEYSSLVAGTSGTVAVTVSETAYDADGLKIFLNNGTALRYRFDSNTWNYNGNSFRSSDSRVPVVGEVVAELRAYVGTPVVAGRAATVTFTVKQTGSGQTGKAVLVDQDNRVVSIIDISDTTVTVDMPVVLAEGHTTSELRAFYSREGASSGGMDLTKLVKSYADSPLTPSSSSSSEASSSVPASSSAPASSSESSSSVASSSSSEASSSVAPSSSSEASSSVAPSSSSEASSSEASSSSTSSAPSGGSDVSFNWASFDPAAYIAILSNPVATTANNVVLQSTTAHSSNGLFFFHSATGTLRHRGGSNLEWNFNGTGFASGDPVAAVGSAADPMRAYIGVPVDAGRDVTLTVVHRNSTSAGTLLGSIVFVGSDGNVLAKYDAKAGTATTTTFNLPAGHTQTEVKILFSREGGGAGGMHLTSIDKTYN